MARGNGFFATISDESRYTAHGQRYAPPNAEYEIQWEMPRGSLRLSLHMWLQLLRLPRHSGVHW